ncbi:hypothetical protein OAM07_04495 [Crocinitomicaceae bacterium]|nr:hypothetical protein [Crocinitomicaceae bacterium]MDC0459995.1 hypothetical protein [Crocinitomicaceae bacterium]
MRLVVQVFSLFILVSSCVKNNPDPSWLEVNEWQLNSNIDLSGLEGELTESITNAQVYIDDQLIGIFEVPFRIPILKTGAVNVKVYPVVINNGISATKKLYPFLYRYEIDAELVQNEDLVINPVTTYKSFTNFWVEDFEDINNSIENDETSTTFLQLSNENLNSFNGNFYGKVVLNEVDSTWVANTTDQLAIPKGSECYLEIDYYVTNDLYTGLLFVSPSVISNNVNVRLNGQAPENAVWKKIYIELKELISSSPNNTQFLQTFTAFLDEGKTEGLICIDNIKVLWD